MTITELLQYAVDHGASDLHITVGTPPVIRANGRLERMRTDKITPQDAEAFVGQMLDEARMDVFKKMGEFDFSFSVHALGRFRVNVFRQRGAVSLAIRTVNIRIPTVEELGLPETVTELSNKNKGLILVTGPTGSGKSTTLAAMIDHINEVRDCHILTLEDPIEYLHRHKKSIVNQREIGTDSQSYATALRAALREDPDVILVGEMRDLETISIAITAAETGHLVLSTLHTVGATKTVDRIIDVFPPHQQQQVKSQLSTILQGVISQELLTRRDKPGRVAAFEIMTNTPAVGNLIREGKTFQIDSFIDSWAKHGMQSMNRSLADLYRRGLITFEDAMFYATDPSKITGVPSRP